MRTPTRTAAPTLSPRFQRRGFTMIELLVVIGIIVVLMSILIPAVGRVQLQARIADTRAQIQKISSAMENYYKDNNAYPGPLPNAIFPGGGPAVAGGNMTMP